MDCALTPPPLPGSIFQIMADEQNGITVVDGISYAVPSWIARNLTMLTYWKDSGEDPEDIDESQARGENDELAELIPKCASCGAHVECTSVFACHTCEKAPYDIFNWTGRAAPEPEVSTINYDPME